MTALGVLAHGAFQFQTSIPLPPAKQAKAVQTAAASDNMRIPLILDIITDFI